MNKSIEVNRKPKRGYNHIFEEEVLESVDAMSAVTDDGAKQEGAYTYAHIFFAGVNH